MNLKWTRKCLIASAILSAVTLALAYALNGFYTVAALLLITGVMWLSKFAQRRSPLASLVFVLFTLFCILGYWLQLSMPLLILALTAMLAAWDLDQFTWRVSEETPVMNLDRMEKHHLQQLLLVLGIGLVIAEVVLLIQISLSFWAVFIAALLVLFSLTRVLALIRREG